MAHTRKDTLTSPGEWAKHLRQRGKRIVAKAERQAVKKEIHAEPDFTYDQKPEDREPFDASYTTDELYGDNPPWDKF